MHNELLYYSKPAKNYMEALPLGNGSLGAMCYSSVGKDVISLNHDTLWTGHPRTVRKEGAYESYLKAQKLALPDKWKKGSVKGLAAKGNVTVDIEWADGKLTDYTIHGNGKKLNIIKCK